MKDTENLAEPEFGPILRGVKLSRVFKAEHIGKLGYHGRCQIDEVNSTKKVKDASDENKLESDASDNMAPHQYQNIFLNENRMTNVRTKHFTNSTAHNSVSKPKLVSCGKSIDGASPFSMISNERSCTKTGVSGSATTNATVSRKETAQKLSYREDSEVNMSVMGFDRKHFVSGGCQKLEERFSGE